MSRIALSLLLLGAMAPTAQAEGIRSLGVTLSPVGAWAATRMSGGVVAGMSGSVDWDFRRDSGWITLGGHVAGSRLFVEATPLRLRLGPNIGPFRPWMGAGASLLLPWVTTRDASPVALRLGGELASGLEIGLPGPLYLSGELRVQSFSLGHDLLSRDRQTLVSAYLGVGFIL